MAFLTQAIAATTGDPIPCWCGRHHWPLCPPMVAVNPFIPPQGCICPPTSEKTCENPSCPRKEKDWRY